MFFYFLNLKNLSFRSYYNKLKKKLMNNNKNFDKKKPSGNKKPSHFWHLVNPSPWPFAVSFSSLNTFMGFVLILMEAYEGFAIFVCSFFLLCCSVFNWFEEIISETKFNGTLTQEVVRGLKLGMFLFIVSEIMFFVAFFWAYYHFALAPAFQIGSFWPPRAIQIFDESGIPLSNTLILLLSGVFVTWTHRELVVKHKIFSKENRVTSFKRKWDGMFSLFIAICLAFLFTACQIREYLTSGFHMADAVYASSFYMATGFHGFHVILGTIFLMASYFRLLFFHFTEESHLGLEFAIWYWHFVDVVWLFLFISIYWWGGQSF